MLDLNAASPQSLSVDLDMLSLQLAACVATWAPRFFPHGRINDDKSELRLADISGRAPRKIGSCVISLTGPLAGCWHDFGTGDGGQPISTLKHGSGLDGRELLDLAAEIVGTTAVQFHESHSNVVKTAVQKPRRDPTSEISHIISRSIPLKNTLAEVYLNSRKLQNPESPDLLFCENVTDFATGMGRPAMIAIPRRADGSPTGGLHRTFLAFDGNGKAAIDRPKKMLGPMENGCIRLAPVAQDGRLGIAEGIETALAAMALYGLPVWATTAAPFLGSFDRSGRWLGFEPPTECRALYIFADRGDAGLKAARLCKERVEQSGLPVAIIEPMGDDDFAHDLECDLDKITLPELLNVSEEVSSTPEIAAPGCAADLAIAVAALGPHPGAVAVEDVMHQLVLLNLSPVATDEMLRSMQSRTGIGMRVLLSTLKEVRQSVAASQRRRQGSENWMSAMILNDAGEPRPLMENAGAVLDRAPEFRGVIWFDEFANRIVVRMPPPWHARNGSFIERQWDDNDDREVTRWLQRAGIPVPITVVHDAVYSAAVKSSFHPVREYLESLEWDRKPRLDRWATEYLGSTDNDYTAAIGARWLISAVARVMIPGCQVDHAMIMEGAQGVRKSTSLRVMFSPWFSDHPEDIGSKDASIQLSGIWCLEYSDLDRWGKADRNRLKSFISRRVDRYRPPFGRFAVDVPRQNIFGGSTNDSTYLDDPTGGRRFWPLKTPHPDPDGLQKVKDQLWAEAVFRFHTGEKFHLYEPELLEAAIFEQRARQHEEPWGAKIRYVLKGGDLGYPRDVITISEILQEMNLPADRWNASVYNRVRDYLQFIGWIRIDGDDGEPHRFVRR